MKKEIIKNLLEDLYTIYNPEHLIYIEKLVDKYHQMPTEAIEMVLIRYNHPNFDHYDKEKATPEYIEQLIQDYAVGNRTLQGLDILSDSAKKKQQEEDKKRIQEEEYQKAISEREDASKREIQKEKDNFQREINEIKKLKEDILEKKDEEPKIVEVEKDWENDLDVSIQVNYKEEELNLPNSKYLSKLGIGARIVTSTKSGKIIGLSIKDIVFDNTTIDVIGKPSVMIFIDKE